MASNSYKKEDSENDTFYLNHHNPIFVINKKGKLIDANDAFCQKLGCTKDDLLGLTLEETGLLT